MNMTVINILTISTVFIKIVHVNDVNITQWCYYKEQ